MELLQRLGLRCLQGSCPSHALNFTPSFPNVRELKLRLRPTHRHACRCNAFTGATTLSSLSVTIEGDHVHLGDLLRATAPTLKSLRIFSLDYAASCIGLDDLGVVPLLTALNTLALLEQSTAVLAASALTYAPIATSLTSLSLSSPLRDVMAHTFAAVQSLPNVTNLSLHMSHSQRVLEDVLNKCPALADLSLSTRTTTLRNLLPRLAPLLVELRIDQPYEGTVICTRLTRLCPVENSASWREVNEFSMMSAHRDRLRQLEFYSHGPNNVEPPFMEFTPVFTSLTSLSITCSLTEEVLTQVHLPHLVKLDWTFLHTQHIVACAAHFLAYIIRRFLTWSARLATLEVECRSRLVAEVEDKDEVYATMRAAKLHPACKEIAFWLLEGEHEERFDRWLDRWRLFLVLPVTFA